jgi:nicotinamidase/pyrazinamidase
MTYGAQDCLLVIDVQNDFMPDGALAVPHGDEVVPVINRLAPAFGHVVMTQDWHPAGHASFASSHAGRAPFQTTPLAYGEQVLWPDHCVQETPGAALHADLCIPHARLVLRKGHHADVDSYSAFLEADRTTRTGLAGYLREHGVTRVFCVGLATDYCVRASALDAIAVGRTVTVLDDLVAAVDPVSGAAALVEIEAAGGSVRSVT